MTVLHTTVGLHMQHNSNTLLDDTSWESVGRAFLEACSVFVDHCVYGYDMRDSEVQCHHTKFYLFKLRPEAARINN